MNRKQRRIDKKSTASPVKGILENAVKYHQVGQLAEAEQLYRQVLSNDPRNADCLHLLGVLAHQNGNHKMAAELITKAISFKRNIDIYHSNLGLALHNLGNFEEAIKHFQQALSINSNNPEAQNNLGITLYAINKFDDAIRAYNAALSLRPNYAEAYKNLGNIYKDQGKFDEALQMYHQAMTLRPGYLEAHNDAGVVLQSLGNFDEAIKQYNYALSNRPSYLEARNNLGSALQDQGKLDEAIIQYQEVLKINPNYIDAYYNLGSVFSKKNKSEEAIKHFTRCVELDPKDKRGVQLLLAGLGHSEIPARASDSHLQELYIKRAQNWDQISENSNLYKAPNLVTDALNKLSKNDEKIDILDVGCGTGLVGTLIRNRARKLIGIDFSASMLEKAKTKNVYDELHQADLVTFMSEKPDSYDAITCAATLIHFGDLSPALKAAAITLRDKGLLICTLFPNLAGKDFAPATSPGLLQGGCYSHSENYILRIANENNFNVELLKTEIHEYHKCEPVMGLIIGLRQLKN